ncbi:hypothetical protein FGG78_06875 [Thioclava sp. BHET1]|uniref:DUF1127 domain-containing protein n=1 Tax=Thioclava dalianensis TaxID=1185766 RepID=A0A074TN54_9RHOB|nr:hypothetical protein [Thioclava dalianensis]KEP71595.1 hypothetical protein DL1_00860 [Thioclava dalianensis]TMV93002.1 hypothetical protein FGG78_06875 [Thioclava sp. BHET1]SFN43682.1 hypothetical protein SAMN05216224_105212 [Thioclava dalianensis]
MAYITTAHAQRAEKSVFARLGAAVLDGLTTYMERQSRQSEIERLHAKSDAELAQMGITRDRIIHHVFRDRFYI